MSDRAPAEQRQERKAPPRRPRILVVDDDPQVVAIVAEWLRDVGDVHVATTSAQAYVLAPVILPDLAIVDVMLPRTDGLALLRSFRSNTRLTSMAAIVITGSDRVDIPSRAADLGVVTVLYKPLDEEVLRDAVRTLTNRR